MNGLVFAIIIFSLIAYGFQVAADEKRGEQEEKR